MWRFNNVIEYMWQKYSSRISEMLYIKKKLGWNSVKAKRWWHRTLKVKSVYKIDLGQINIKDSMYVVTILALSSKFSSNTLNFEKYFLLSGCYWQCENSELKISKNIPIKWVQCLRIKCEENKLYFILIIFFISIFL